MRGLAVENLTASVQGVEILKGLNLDVPAGELHAVMGPNGSGKSTLCHVLTGKADYTVGGSASVHGHNVLTMDVDERARLGLMQSFQYPVEVPGVSLRMFLEEAAVAGMRDVEAIGRLAPQFGMDAFLDRALNDDLSGGEKKRSEIYQLAVLRPTVVMLDEIDSGLDIDAVRQVAAAVNELRNEDTAIVMITHYNRILEFVTPDRVHIMMNGTIVDSGGPELAGQLEDGGYEEVRTRLGITTEEPEEQAPTPVSQLFTDTPFDV